MSLRLAMSRSLPQRINPTDFGGSLTDLVPPASQSSHLSSEFFLHSSSWIGKMFCTDIHDSMMMNLNDFGNPLMFFLVPP